MDSAHGLDLATFFGDLRQSEKKLSEAKPPLFWVQITWKSYLKLFIINYIKSKVELHVMDKHCVEVRMQLQKYNLLKMAVIDVGQNVEQKSMNFSYFFYKTGWKFIAWKLRKKEYVKFQVIWMQVTYFVLLLILYIALKILGSHWLGTIYYVH